MSEIDTGYSVVIGKPVVHTEKKATGSSVSFPCEAIPDGSYLVSLEVNGSVEAYRESMDFSSGSCTVGAYTLSYSSYALTVSGTSNNDIVRVMVEPLDVKTTDAFRAAVKKVAPETPNELPAVTDADDGKALTVNVTKEKGAVIVPEQSVNVSFGPPAQLSNTVDDLFVEGAKVIMTVDGVEYAATVEDISGTLRAMYNGDGINVNFAMSLGHVSIAGPTGTHTVSVNIENSSVGWEAQTSGGGVLVVTDTSGTLNKTVTEITAVDFAVVKYEEATGFVASVVLDGKSGEYDVRVITANEGSVVAVRYIASSADGYPVLNA